MSSTVRASATRGASERASAPTAPRRIGTFASLANRDFRYLLAGTMGMQVGSWSQTIGQGWLVHEMTHSAVQLGLISFIRGIAMLGASPFGGLVSDLFDRRRVVIWGTLLAALNGLALAVLVATGTVQVWHLYVMAAIDGVLNALNQPARQALVYDVVGKEELTNAVALSSVGSNIMRVIGPSLAGALIGTAGVASCFIFQGVCYVLSAVVSLLIRPVKQQSARLASLRDSLLGGFAYAHHNREIVLLLLVALVPSLLVYPYVGFVPVFASDVLHVGAFQYGVLMTAVGVGSIPGAFVAANMTHIRHKGLILIVTSAGYMGMVMAFALSPLFLAAFACLAIAGFANAIQNTLNSTLVQFSVSDEYRGRVSALYFMTGGLTPFGSLAMGGLIAAVGAPPAVAAFAALATAAVLVLGALSRRLRAM
ncbi:MAG TPA: MFS transporter [Dehalococcoidia bacterium]|nr:MFS transporter [Dehalococcoidia bacterium]